MSTMRSTIFTTIAGTASSSAVTRRKLAIEQAARAMSKQSLSRKHLDELGRATATA